ncbi:MAG: hypothetical protein K2K63_17130 [Acetatifactor sp.]|nr:hypothetical protein [Acetatifactor sp.]
MSIIDVNRDSWNKQADRYQKNAMFSFDEVDYGNSSCPKEKDLKLIGDVKGKKILELGCGGANCGIALAKQGAKMTCLDLSSEQINRMLKSGGTFVFSLNDPIFYSVAFGSIWKEDGISDNLNILIF